MTFLLTGIVLAVLSSAVAIYGMRSRRRIEETIAANLDTLEKLHQVAAMLGVHARPPDEVLRQMMDATCSLLDVPKAFICKLERTESGSEAIRLVYHTGFKDTPPDWTTRPLETTPAMAHTMRTREPLYVPDVLLAESPITDVLKMQRYRIRAIQMFPLLAGPEVIGVMVLADSMPRKFSEAERRLGRLWASQCAVTLVNQRLAFESAEAVKEQRKLNEQVQRDAQTKVLLLSELNHRVKNNMTRVVGFLSAESPALSVEAHLWLDRAISRITTLARAHELFVDSRQSVDLTDLIEKVLEPVRALLPPNARVSISNNVTGSIGPDNGVTLAMVLHELATNAVEHGIGPTGTLRIAVSCVDAKHVQIEVADDGRHGAERSSKFDGDEKSPTRRTRMGLHIVRGLVGRELRGTFAMTIDETRGSLATIQFPAAAVTCGPSIPKEQVEQTS